MAGNEWTQEEKNAAKGMKAVFEVVSANPEGIDPADLERLREAVEWSDDNGLGD